MSTGSTFPGVSGSGETSAASSTQTPSHQLQLIRRGTTELYILPPKVTGSGSSPSVLRQAEDSESSQLDIQNVFLVNHLIKETFVAFKFKMNSQNLKRWTRNKTGIQDGDGVMDRPESYKEQMNLLMSQGNGYSFELDLPEERDENSDSNSPPTIIFWKEHQGKGSGKRQLGSIDLEMFPVSEAVSLLVNGVLSTLKIMSQTLQHSESSLQDSQRQNTQILSTLKSLTLEKNKMEDSLYRAFARSLNTKKEKILELESQLSRDGQERPGTEGHLHRSSPSSTPTPTKSGKLVQIGKSSRRRLCSSPDSESDDTHFDGSGDDGSKTCSDYNASTSEDDKDKPNPKIEQEESDSLGLGPNPFLSFSDSQGTRGSSSRTPSPSMLRSNNNVEEEELQKVLVDPTSSRLAHVVGISPPTPSKQKKLSQTKEEDLSSFYDNDRLIDEFI